MDDRELGEQELGEREDALRTDVARLVQAMRLYLSAPHVPGEITPLVEPVQHLAGLLAAGAPAEHLRQAALTAVDVYESPSPQSGGGDDGLGDDGLVLDPSIQAAVERLRTAIDALDSTTPDPADPGPPGTVDSGPPGTVDSGPPGTADPGPPGTAEPGPPGSATRFP